jgi:hypothetical protein
VGWWGSPVAGLVLLVAAGGCGGRDQPRAFPIPGDSGDRIIVEVLNASGKPGLARAGTRILRQAGIDVVSFGNAPAGTGPVDSTRIVIRRGPASVGARIRAALKVGRVVFEPDSTRLLDASVLLGGDFRVRTELHP